MTAYDDGRVSVHLGDCLDVLRTLPDASVDAVVTDPPYGLVFMGKHWDDHVDNARFGEWCRIWSVECLRVLKPGGHMVAFGGTRTWHRLACAVEDAGFEIRDSIAWLYGSGFPKSLDVSKAIDKAAGAERKVIGIRKRPGGPSGLTAATGWNDGPMAHDDATVTETAPATDAAREWAGWGTALKPAFEPVVVARKPLGERTVAANVLAHGTGALNVDACRVEAQPGDYDHAGNSNSAARKKEHGSNSFNYITEQRPPNPAGRWPANVVLDESQAAALDEQSGEMRDGVAVNRNRTPDNDRATYSAYQFGNARGGDVGYGGQGGASRFFYVAKAPAAERPRVNGAAHPTVKPLDLMRWLVRLVTPPGGTVLEPFAGSGTTVEACIVEGFRCIAIEREADYLPLILQRIHRRRDPVAAIRQTRDDLGLFELDGEPA